MKKQSGCSGFIGEYITTLSFRDSYSQFWESLLTNQHNKVCYVSAVHLTKKKVYCHHFRLLSDWGVISNPPRRGHTLPKTNSSHSSLPKIGPAPKRNCHLPTIQFWEGELLVLGRVQQTLYKVCATHRICLWYMICD